MIRILSTLLQPDGGRASVAGYDVVSQPQHVRAAIGLTGQFAAVDEDLTGRENLVLVGRLVRLPKAVAADRAAELLDAFELTDAADRVVRGYSGGMRRRLDLGASLIASPAGAVPRRADHRPRPPQPAAALGGHRPAPRRGQDHRADHAVHGGGRPARPADQRHRRRPDHRRGHRRPAQDKVGGDVLDLRLGERGARPARPPRCWPTRSGSRPGELTIDDELGVVLIPVQAGAAALVDAVRALDGAGVRVADLGLRRPSLDDVFLSLTGHVAEEPRPDAPEPRPRRGRPRM